MRGPRFLKAVSEAFWEFPSLSPPPHSLSLSLPPYPIVINIDNGCDIVPFITEHYGFA